TPPPGGPSAVQCRRIGTAGLMNRPGPRAAFSSGGQGQFSPPAVAGRDRRRGEKINPNPRQVKDHPPIKRQPLPPIPPMPSTPLQETADRLGGGVFDTVVPATSWAFCSTAQ